MVCLYGVAASPYPLGGEGGGLVGKRENERKERIEMEKGKVNVLTADERELLESRRDECAKIADNAAWWLANWHKDTEGFAETWLGRDWRGDKMFKAGRTKGMAALVDDVRMLRRRARASVLVSEEILDGGMEMPRGAMPAFDLEEMFDAAYRELGARLD